MVVPPPRPRRLFSDDTPDDEERTYREATKVIRETVQDIYNERIRSLEIRCRDRDDWLEQTTENVRIGAQTANNNLQQKLEAAIADLTERDRLQYAGSTSSVKAVEEKLSERLLALKQLIDLRAEMSQEAVGKATDANEKRFEGVNEFRSTLSDQARNFVTVDVLNARIGQTEGQVSSLERQYRAESTITQATINTLSTRMTAREVAETSKREIRSDDHLTIGSIVGIIGGIVGVVSLIGTLALNHGGAGQPPATPTIGVDSKRVDDLVSRLNELSSRIPPVTNPVIPASR